MKNLLFYLLGGFVRVGKISLCKAQIAGEDALRIELECSDGHFVTSFVILRSELNCIREEYNKRLPYMCDSEIADFCKLFNAMP